MATPKVPVKTGQTLAQFAKANDTTVAAILADPRNAVIASRVAAGTTPIFGGSKVAIPVKNVAPSSTYVGGTKVTPEEPLLAMPSDVDMAAAETAYQSAMVDLDPNYTPPPTVIPGAGGGNVFAPERMLARDTFANTFALAFGASEASKSYVSKLYELTSSFYKSGSTMDESINLAIRKARVDNEIPEFTQRFKGLFALDDMLKAGKLVKVPTVAEYIASENQVAELLNNAGMSDIATSEVIGEVLGKGKSVSEVGRILTGAFAAIDNAPEAFKRVLSEKYPTVTRTGLAQALIGGTAGAAALEKEIKNLGVIAAARQQGVNITATQAANIGALGYDYQGSLQGMATVAQTQGTYQKLEEISKGQRVTDAGSRVAGAVFEKNAADISAIDALTQQEIGRYSGRSGRLASRDRAQGLI